MAVGIKVDITNPSDIGAKLAEVRRQIGKTEQGIESLKKDLQSLREAEGRLAMLAGEKVPEAPARRSSVKRVIEVVEGIAGPASVAAISGALEPPMKRKTVGWALWQAAQDDLIQKLGNGIYAPLSYKVTELPLNGAEATKGGDDET